MKMPWHPDRMKTMADKVEDTISVLQKVLIEARTIERQSLMNYEDFCIALKEHGFELEVADYSWRHPHSGACASVEAMQDMCRLWPTLLPRALKIMVSGHSFCITVQEDKDGLGATVRLQPQGLLDHIATKI